MVVPLRGPSFWVMTLRHRVNGSRIFEGTACLLLQRSTGPRINVGNRLPMTRLHIPGQSRKWKLAKPSQKDVISNISCYNSSTPLSQLLSTTHTHTHTNDPNHLNFATGDGACKSPQHWRLWQNLSGFGRVCVCVCIYIYIYIHTYTHTHTHT